MRAIGRFLILLGLAVTLVACGGSSSGKSRDTTAPVITLTGANPQVIEAGTAYVELGATASDNRDGDLTNSIAIDAGAVDTQVPGNYVVTYTVTDAAGNSGTASRTVVVEDTTPPVITLLGDDPQVIVAGSPYIELGATASDTLDGDLTAAIVVDATAVDTMVAGDYTVIYDITDAAGNAAVTVTRTVRVELPPPPAAPQVSVEGDIKQLIFSWENVANADYYRLMENADGHSGFTQVGGDIPMDTLSAKHDIAVHLHDWVNALYMIKACNLGGCTGSAEIAATDVMLDTIGYFKASNTTEKDYFGSAIALSNDGKTLAVSKTGGAYVFRHNGIEWYQQAVMTGSNTEPGDHFGYAIALSTDGHTLAVGASREDSSATGINGDQADNSAAYSGAVYVFRFDSAHWIQQAYIKASNTDPGDRFGGAVALSSDGNTLAVGAALEDSASTGINGDQYDDWDPCGTSGAVYLFRFDGAGWSQQAYIKASNTGVSDGYRDGVDYKGCIFGDEFGTSVALSSDGNILAVGAPTEDSSATGINGDQSDSPYGIEYDNGAVYTFAFDGVSWSQNAYIKPSFSHPTYYFGDEVALGADGKTLAVGAHLDASTATGANDPPLNVDRHYDLFASGAVHLFRHDGSSWSQESYIKSSDPAHEDAFGIALALNANGNALAVGAPGEDSFAKAIGGDQFDDSASSAGAAYVFRFGVSGWTQESYVKASNTDSGDRFGGSISLNEGGIALAVGASGEDSSATGINADQTDNSADGSGAVYVY